ncbi:MAG: PIG-L family deacetylase, partial [Gemmatimonadetes bacterium]|nr:PIG-L family deacetylase [Gemmatimonadota bacterium]
MTHGRTATTLAIAVAALTAVLLPAAAPPVAAQQDPGIVGAALRMRQLDGVKRVLMIAAHPDDEDTGLLTALARGMGAETAYLSLSRGEGGQNLIGPRLHEGLGVIRTGELLAARALDGGGQYFTRAFDFGYSKSLDEALEFWPMEEVLRDVVYVVRKFRPHVIVSVFSGTPRDGHGQHQLAGLAAREAFAVAGDPGRFPELGAQGVTPWQPAKLYVSTRFNPRDATVSVPTGTFDPVLGRSHHQLAMESRSRHRSQDMGSGQSMGPRSSSLRLEASVVEGMEDDGIFAGVDTTLLGQLGTPLPAGWPADTGQRLDRYRGALADAAEGFSVTRPGGAVASLAEAVTILRGLVDEGPDTSGRRVLERRLAQVSEALLAAAGVVTDVRVGRDLITPGESVVVDVTVWNGGALVLAGGEQQLLPPAGGGAGPTGEAPPSPSRAPFFRAQAPPTPDDGRIGAGEIGRWSWRVAVPP